MPFTLANPEPLSREAPPLGAASTASRPFQSPSLLRLWHLASLDAPTVAVVWALAFAWAAKVRLPAWIPALLALAAWAVYVGDRLLDARAALGTSQFHRLRERHRFHWRHRSILIPMAVTAACVAACIVFFLMPAVARERNSVLATAAFAYFTRVHSRRKASPFLFPLLPKELLVGLLFTAACALPAGSRAAAQPGSPLWILTGPVLFFAALAWLNCHAIERWESKTSQQNREKHIHFASQRLKVHFAGQELKGTGFSPYNDLAESGGASAPEGRPSELSTSICPFSAAILLTSVGLLSVAILAPNHLRLAALVAAGAASALLLALLDRCRHRLTPIALRAAADLVLLAPLILLLR